MKSVLLSFLVAVATFSNFLAQEVTPAVNPNAADIAFETEQYNFGTLKQGSECAYDFKFTNTGKEPLIISNAQPSCGCTVPQWPKEPIKPGESAYIKVKYDSNRVGPFDKSITITSNAKTQQKIIKITGKIEAKPVEEPFPSNGLSKSGIPFEGR